MSRVAARIEQAPACEIINLTEAEKNIYPGAGRALAVFTNGEITKIFQFGSTVPYIPDESPEQMIAKNIKFTRRWLDDAEFEAGDGTEIWFVRCSCYQLCEPRRISSNVAASMAFLAREIGDYCEEFLNE